MSTSTNDGGGDKKPPSSRPEGLAALDRLRTATTDDRKEVASVDDGPKQKDSPPNIPRNARRVFSSRVPRNVGRDDQSRKLTKRDRITFWQRVVSRIPKALADEYNAQVDAQLAEQQSSSESGTAPQGSSTSGNNQSTQNRLREESQGQNKKSWLESFRSWLRRRKSMPTTPSNTGAGGSGATAPVSATSAPTSPAASSAPATGAATTSPAAAFLGTTAAGTPAAAAPATAASGSTAPARASSSAAAPSTHAATTAAGATASAPPAPSAGAPDPALSSGSWWHPIWSLGTVAVIALVIICFAGFYAFRDQNVVNEIKDAQRMRERVVEDQLTFEKRRAQAEANSAEILAQGGVITPSVPVITIQHVYPVVTNSSGDVQHPKATNPQPQQVAPVTIIVTNTINVPPNGSPTVIQVPTRQRYYWDDPSRWSRTYIFVP